MEQLSDPGTLPWKWEPEQGQRRAFQPELVVSQQTVLGPYQPGPWKAQEALPAVSSSSVWPPSGPCLSTGQDAMGLATSCN